MVRAFFWMQPEYQVRCWFQFFDSVQELLKDNAGPVDRVPTTRQRVFGRPPVLRRVEPVGDFGDEYEDWLLISSTWEIALPQVRPCPPGKRLAHGPYAVVVGMP